MKNILTSIISILLLTFSVAHAQTYMVTAKLTGFKNDLKVKLLDDNDNPLGQTLLKNGTFSFTGNLKGGPKYVTIDIAGEYQCTVFAGAGNVAITGSKAQFPHDLTITGPAEQVRFNAYQKAQKPFNLQRDELMKALNAVKPGDTATNNKIVRQYNGISKKSDVVVLKFIFEHPDAFYAARDIYDFQHQLSKDKIGKFYSSLTPEVKSSIYGKRLKLLVSPVVGINEPIYDLTAQDQHGNTQRLSNFKGSFILLDFSSVHCGPCNESIEELRMISTKYSSKLKLITFSPDSRKDWLKGIKDDKVSWLTLSDGKGYYSENMLRYGINSEPTFILISPDGKVIDKWEGYGKPASGMSELEKHVMAKVGKL